MNAFNDAEANKSKLNSDILNLQGYSGRKTRHLLNNICSNLSLINKKNYLEIGCWYGSTFISSLYKNNICGTAIDNWSEFNNNGDVQQTFKENINKFLENNSNINIIEHDSFTLNLDTFTNKINFYMYDGGHDIEDHKRAITYYKDILDDIFILYVDDWSWEKVRIGTYDGFKEANIEILYKIEKYSDQCQSGQLTYWNGFGLFVCKKLL